MIICINGQFVTESEAQVSVFDHGFLYGDGVYETLRTHGGKIFQIEAHLARLERSCELSHIILPYSREELVGLIRDAILRNGFLESRVRVTVTRGMSTTFGAAFDPAAVKQPTLIIAVYPLDLWQAGMRADPVRVVTFRGERSYPEVKSLNMMTNVLARLEAGKSGAYDALLVDRDGLVTEGAGTNFFLVRGGRLVTPDRNILFGTTRAAILDMVGDIVKGKIEVELRDVRVEELRSADEMFLTNAPKGILPVSHVDGLPLGDGVAPGPVTSQMETLFDAYISDTIR